MRGHVPTLMVSSTFYDLKEVRQQLARFVRDDLGYEPLISENPAFPIDPDADAIENCRRRVEQNADVLVLVVGARYGFVEPDSGKSVTNLEYLAARAKGIPVYAFIEKSVLTLFEAWRRAGPEVRAALGGTVDDRRLFEFIDGVRTADSVWMVGFETAGEIVASLRAQLAYQMHAGLELQRTLRRHPERELLQGLTGKAFRIALERPRAWEYRLFGQVLADEVAARADLRREYDLKLTFGAEEYLSDANFGGWGQARLREVMRLSEQAGRIVNGPLQEALGPPGVAGNASDLVFLARRLGRVYQDSIEWALRVRRTHPEESDHQAVLDALALCSGELVIKLAAWPTTILASIEDAVAESARAEPDAEQRVVQVTLTLEGGGMTEFNQVLRAVYAARGVPVGPDD